MTDQLDLTSWAPKGKTIEPCDIPRLSLQQMAVWLTVQPGEWLALNRIARLSGAPEASASARLRDLRHLGFKVERKRVKEGGGLWLYRVTRP